LLIDQECDEIHRQIVKQYTFMPEDCKDCSLANTCIPSAFAEHNIHKLDKIVSPTKQYPRHRNIYHQGSNFQALYIVKSGALKTYITNSKGDENITGFYMPGDIVGLESISKRRYLNTAKTLTDSRLCRVNYQELAELRKYTPALSDWAINLFSLSLASGQDFFNCLSQHTAVARLATFLLTLSKRTSRSDQYQLDFQLPMSRQDIGSYLGLANETTSRAFTRLVDKNCIHKMNKEIHIVDLEALQECSNLTIEHSKESY
jgi:CRP/FNR family transcriptional regulator, anaerobic regulatory protein